MDKKKLFGLFLVLVMVLLSLTGCGSKDSTTESSDGSEPASSSGQVSITVFNSKMEIQSQMEEMAKKYSEEKGVDIEVYYSSDTVAQHLATKYASNDPYTVAMVDAKDIYALDYEIGRASCRERV